MRIALIGTRGVPARYGGFETCVEEVGARLVEAGHEVVVYCRNSTGREPSYRGMRLVHLPAVPRQSMETLSHTAVSVAHTVARHRPDVAFVFNAANAPLLPLLRARRIPVATHVDGLEWRRTKWSGTGQRYYRAAEALAVRYSDGLIADAQGIADYYRAEFDAPTRLIRYGAPQISIDDADALTELGLTRHGYHLAVARFEPENNLHLIVAGHAASAADKPLIVVGDAPYADSYIASVRAMADERTRFLGSVWDQDLLDSLYANSFVYWHGHSVGGTNPSLLRAIGAGAPCIAHDNVFNREVLGEAGRYFADTASAAALADASERDPDATLERGRQLAERAGEYTWDEVAQQYEALAEDLATRRLRRPRLSGRRNPSAQWQPTR